jgi:hypothetical protein
MITVSATPSIESHIQKILSDFADSLREACIQKAVEDFEAALRKQVGITAIQLLDYYSVERTDSEVIIRVRIEKS